MSGKERLGKLSAGDATGHLAALFTCIVWGTTVIASTKLLQGGLTSAEVVIARFLIAFLLLNIIYPPRLKFESVKRELTYALGGLLGVTLYFFLEITALKYTKAANESVIFSTAPLYTGLLALIFDKQEKPGWKFFGGFVLAISGVILITFEDGFSFSNGIKGDLFALGSAFAWGAYTLLTKKINTYGHHVVQTTRRIFMYGLIFMIPTIFIFDINFKDYACLKQPSLLFCLLYLGLIASGICFITWSHASAKLGPVTTSTYIYSVPLITILFSLIFLREQKLTLQLFGGTLLIIIGLVLSVTKSNTKKRKKKKS